ncbi:hypothetical protein [Streptomyces olivochromogenes]|uniref:Uncharacterized protein n=1 Tax=Streptomyces olivochromogenes TaxID=1963 RepID=A0A250VT14_STROL|nr:hypothetical protein [Streptomyces olivochromogenes]KUN38289.1 hypothetical protein AQJ27_45135 [Streptomyces olivochromogenes]GAX57265.1 hypothetical protein SO3561_08835 [Streptomyces olivochromogenes]
MSSAAYATFATVFALIAFGHALLAWTRRSRTGSTPRGGRSAFNYLVSGAVFFAGTAVYCAVLA